MIELLQILFLYMVFSLTIFTPINVLSGHETFKKFKSLDLASFNLAININLLLLISLLNISLLETQKYIIIFYSLLLIFLYKNNLKEFFKEHLRFYPILIVFFIISISVASNLKLGWDAKFFYYIKSLYFLEGKTLENLKEFNSHHYHPHLGSYLWAFFRNLSFIDHEYFGRLFYVFIFSFSVFYIIPNKKTEILPIAYLLIILSIFFNYNFFSGLQEIIIFSFLMIISRYFYNLSTIKNVNLFVFIVLYLNLIFWIKTDGLVYILIFMLMINFKSIIPMRDKIIFSLTIFLLIILKTIIYNFYGLNLNAQPVYNLDYITNLDFNSLLIKIKYVSIWFAYYSLNNIFFISGVLFIIYLNFDKKFNKEDLRSLNLYLFLIISFIFSAYILRDQDIIYSIRTTMDRLVMTSSGFFVYVILVNFDKIIAKKFK